MKLYNLKRFVALTLMLFSCHWAWADTWDGTNYSFAENKFADEGLTVDGHDGKSWEKSYVITNARQLAYFAWIVKNNKTGRASAYYWKLGADIDLNGTNYAWSFGSNAGGAFQGHFDGQNHTISNIKLNVTTNSNYGLLTTIQGASATSLAEVKNLNISNVTIATDANDRGSTTKLGALTGYVKNATVTGVAVSNVTITHNGNTTGNNYVGGLVGQVEGASGGQTKVLNCSVENVVINLNGDISGTTHVGGAIGYLGAYALVDGISVKGESSAINGPTSADKTIKNGVQFFVGGFLGYQHSSGTGAFQPNKFQNIAVTDIDINLGRYVPGGVINNHKFAIGGIAGCVNAPNRDNANNLCGMPENIIFKGGKIYAPYAATSPTVPNFNSGTAAHNNLTTETITAIDALDKAKTKTWYYSDYELGLSPALLKASDNVVVGKSDKPATGKFRLNCEATFNGTKQYITVKSSTFDKQNRYQDNVRDSWTVLWWTTQNNWASGGPTATLFTNEEQPIYPQSSFGTVGTAELVKFPYYMYFYQGVANANYVTPTVATNIIAGIEANKTATATFTISNNKEDERGFDQRTISVKAVSNETDVTSNYNYTWYVNGTAQSGSGSSITLTPHWKDGQGITVNAINKSTSAVVATATYTLAPGVLKTQASVANASAEKIRSDIKTRGTSANPYIIDCENALRQLSYLSTAHTGTLWEGVIKPVSPFPTNQIAGHYNRAYYELGADITMSSTPFVPISHVGYGGDGTWGTYNGNFMFQGVFDGKGHKISNLKITWGAGQYNGNNTNIYYGLFGAVGNTTGTAAAVVKWGETSASNTVIKNLVIDGATLTHDVNNTTFSYRKNYSHITSDNGNNCMVGVLAGVVGGYTDIQNIEIRGSKITDETTTSNYNLAKMGLYVGGAIGSVQCAFNQTGNVPTGVKIQHIAAQVDITLTHTTFACPDNDKKVAEVGQFNVGGIIGRYIATNATAGQPDAAMPSYTLYSGTINATKAWISPVLAALRYKDQQGNGDWKNYSKQWEGNNNSSATQVKINNVQYYKFKIGTTDITDAIPASTCGLGFRTLTAHIDASENAVDYVAQKYQGVNYGAKNIATKGFSLELLNKERTDNYSFVWDDSDAETAFVHLTTEKYLELSLARDAMVDNKFTATMEGVDAAPDTYKWEVSFNGVDNWHEIDGETSDTYIVPVSLKTKYVKATAIVDDKPYTTLYEIVEADKELCKPAITTAESDDKITFTFNLNQKDVANKPEFTTTYEWYKTKTEAITPAENNQKLTLQKSAFEGSGYNKVVFCKANVNEHGEKVGEFFIIYGATVVYVKGDGGVDNPVDGEGNLTSRERGWTPETAVKTIDNANKLLKSETEGGTVDNNVIVVIGILNSDYIFQSDGQNPTTITGKYDGRDYDGVIRLKQVNPTDGEHSVNLIGQTGKKGSNCYVCGDTKFENLTFYGNKEGNTFIELHGRDVIFGKGLVMQNFNNLSDNHGNFGKREQIPEFTILLYATNLSEEKINEYTTRIHTRGKPQTVTFQSGHYGRLMAGRFTQDFFFGTTESNRTKWEKNTAYSILGSAAKPIWAVINVEIDKDNEQTNGITGTNQVTYTRDINAIIAGLTDGSMYGDCQINFYGGNVAYIVGSNQGNAINNGGATYTPKDGAKGKWGQWPNASYFGRTVINVDDKSGVGSDIKPITVGNLYAGGLGRKVQSGSNAFAAVDMYLYGRTEVNVKSGTVSGSVYGGGVGGVIGVSPWDAHLPYATNDTNNVDAAIQNGVQYGDNRLGTEKWSNMTPDSPMAKVTLRNLKAEGSGYDEEQCDLRNSSTTVNIFNGNVNGNVYGGGYGFVQDMPEGSAMQGVGSVFGTTNINISGGNIIGNVFGGSQGDTKYYNQTNKYGQTITHIAEMNGTVNMHITGHPTIGGDIFGGGQGISSLSAEEEYLRIATTGNEDLAGQEASEEEKDKYRTDINIIIEVDDDCQLQSSIYGGGMMGAVDGTTNIVIRSGQINGNVYGGGKGEKGHLQKARVNGSTNVTIGY